MPRPQYVKDLLRASAQRDEQVSQEITRRTDDAVRFVIGLQEQAGIDIISDGEWRRETYVDVIADVLSGFEWVKREEFVSHQMVTRPVSLKRPGVAADEARFLRQHTDRHIKVCLPSPYLI